MELFEMVLNLRYFKESFHADFITKSDVYNFFLPAFIIDTNTILNSFFFSFFLLKKWLFEIYFCIPETFLQSFEAISIGLSLLGKVHLFERFFTLLPPSDRVELEKRIKFVKIYYVYGYVYF